MAGYEQLTSQELMMIVWLIVSAFWFYSIAIIIRSLLNYKTIKSVEISFKISNTSDKSLVEKWLEKRKEKKKDEMSTVLRGDGKSF